MFKENSCKTLNVFFFKIKKNGIKILFGNSLFYPFHHIPEKPKHEIDYISSASLWIKKVFLLCIERVFLFCV